MRRVLFFILVLAMVPMALTKSTVTQAANTPVEEPVVFAPGAGDVISLPPSMGVSYLQERGYRVFVAPFGDNNLQNAYILASTVRYALAVTGASKVHIVALSMGGLPALYYQKVLGGTQYVDTWTGLDMQTGAQPVGSELNRCLNLIFRGGNFFGHACSYSQFMKQITEGEPTPGPTFYAAIMWELVPPTWPGDCVVDLPPTGHLDPYFLPSVWDGVIATFSHQCPQELAG